ncbi:MAG: DUF1778 domain-containing protein [Coriobacteriia bacterium]|nr:DUF1778 domain-containing protein [Coriobacteriia bacterium]
MAEYKLANGYVLSDEEIERSAAEWEAGSWEGDLITLRVGRPRLSEEENKNISFKCPASAAELIERAAKVQGVKKSEFIRSAALQKAAQVLSASLVSNA